MDRIPTGIGNNPEKVTLFLFTNVFFLINVGDTENVSSFGKTGAKKHSLDLAFTQSLVP